MEKQAVAIAVLAVVNIPVYLLVGRMFFHDWDDFFTALFYWFKPDFFSLFQGEYFDDMIAEFKLGIFILICVAIVAAEYTGLVKPLLL